MWQIPSRGGDAATYCLRLLVLQCCITMVMGGLKGFGLIFQVEPMIGSTAGGTEIHVAGAGFAYVTALTIGGNSCFIHKPSVRDGQLTCYTPPGNHGNAEIAAHFTSGHIAKLRGSSFQYRNDATPTIVSMTPGGTTQTNITMYGDLIRVLASNQRANFQILREKRNATEILHAYLGTGEIIMQDKAGPEEFRCDMIETPSRYIGVCQVNEKTPAGFYNLTYVTDGVPSTAEEDGPTVGYGSSKNTRWGGSIAPHRSWLTAKSYFVTIYPELFAISSPKKRTGRLGGATVQLKANAAGVNKGNFATRYVALLDGVPCIGDSAHNFGGKDYINCIAGRYTQKSADWPSLADQPPVG